MDKKKLIQTPSQTAGPYFAYGLLPEQYRYNHKQVADNILYKNGTVKGERILIKGQVLDGEGQPIDDAVVEIRQDHSLDGFGRLGTGTEPGNAFVFHTFKPESKGIHAPSINVVILMRGLLNHLFTRIYFEDEAGANKGDPVMKKVPEDRRHTLLARREEQRGQVIYRFDIHMQGPNETVFFDA